MALDMKTKRHSKPKPRKQTIFHLPDDTKRMRKKFRKIINFFFHFFVCFRFRLHSVRSIWDDFIVYMNINVVALEFFPGFLRNGRKVLLCKKRVQKQSSFHRVVTGLQYMGPGWWYHREMFRARWIAVSWNV